jgi:hypothetical protein
MGKSKTNAIKHISMSRLRSMGLDADMITLAHVLLGMGLFTYLICNLLWAIRREISCGAGVNL